MLCLQAQQMHTVFKILNAQQFCVYCYLLPCAFSHFVQDRRDTINSHLSQILTCATVNVKLDFFLSVCKQLSVKWFTFTAV